MDEERGRRWNILFANTDLTTFVIVGSSIAANFGKVVFGIDYDIGALYLKLN